MSDNTRGSRAQISGVLTLAGYDPVPVLDEAEKFPGRWAYTPDRHRCAVLHYQGKLAGDWELRDCAESEDQITEVRRQAASWRASAAAHTAPCGCS